MNYSKQRPSGYEGRGDSYFAPTLKNLRRALADSSVISHTIPSVWIPSRWAKLPAFWSTLRKTSTTA